MIQKILFLTFVLTLSAWLSIRAVNSVADWHQWSVDNAYNKGRAMERYCAKDNDAFAECQKHRLDTGHILFTKRDWQTAR